MSEREGSGPITDEQKAPLLVGRTYKVTPQGDLEAAIDPGPVLAGIRRAFRFLVIATVAVYLALAGVGFYAYSTSTANQQAVCNLRTDLQQRVKQGEDFVEKHPQQLQELGITQTQVTKEINNQRRTLDALNVVNCD